MEEELDCLGSMYPEELELDSDSPSSGVLAIDVHDQPSVKLKFKLEGGYPETAGSCSVDLSCEEMNREQTAKLNEWAHTWLVEAAGSEMQLIGLVSALPECFDTIGDTAEETSSCSAFAMRTLTLERAKRQVEEIRQLEESEYYSALAIDTPKLLQRLRKCVSSSSEPSGATKQLGLSLRLGEIRHEWCDAILGFSLPPGYPDTESCQHSLVSEKFSQACMDHCASEIKAHLENFAGNECMLTAIEYLASNGGALLAAVEGGEDEPGREVTFIRYNHLFKGPEHKKEKAMVDTAKKDGLQGAVLYGTPGIVLLINYDENDVQDYMSACKTIGKRPDPPVVLRTHPEALEVAGVGGLAQQKRGGKLAEIDIRGLRIMLGGDEAKLKEALGVKGK
jgi:hypothetical protein